MAGFKRHVFVCLNERPAGHPRGCCLGRASEDIFNHLKSGAAKAGLKGEVRINRAGCLDHCEHGPTVVVYPEGTWYHVPTKQDAQEVLEKHIVGGQVVEHLLIDNIA
ncbi:MAG: (2Fe-2S) ferredoxin domain-containing protein [Betaproteobacteria bacterium]|nr:(2Fe-2S) ferredoxin domain-containing protein [Betaproteobacteria bacterium]MBM3354734.1 (2Fe-2S) ferredoxin domain-containing protein [Betaproteobacteria bacterium]MBM3384599.1 (2Fe-2S) ferredoxin domain-containing protein [Betaproteobacteria bacterium]